MRTKKYRKKIIKRVRMTKRPHERTFSKRHNFRKRKSKLTKRMKNRRTFSKKRSRAKRGGFGKGACPFVGDSWDATGKAYFFKHSKNGVSPGGTPVFPGDHSPAPQNGGKFLQPIINLFRLGEIGGKNVVNRYKGVRLTSSPLPMYDQLKR